MNDESRDFDDDYKLSEEYSESKEVKEIYGKKLKSKIIKRTKIIDRIQQKSGYDIVLELNDGRVLTIEEKFRRMFYPDILLEIRHDYEDNSKKTGWLYKSEAEILAYFQLKNDILMLTLWKLKELSNWSKTKEFIELVNEEIIKERWSKSKRNGVRWKTKNYAIPFYILRNKGFEYKKNDGNTLPLEIFF